MPSIGTKINSNQKDSFVMNTSMLKEFLTNKTAGFIKLMDIGASGKLDPKWQLLSPLLELTGFEPNIDECIRLAEQKTDLYKQTYLPYALSGKTEERELNETSSIYCWSLLNPNSDWLNRFSFSDLFTVLNKSKIKTFALDDISEIKNHDFDAVKMDTQGMELPILKGGKKVLDNVFFLETETGFLDNYEGETTFSQVSEYLLKQNFIMFDINPNHRIRRKGPFENSEHSLGQPLWCEAVWLKDLIQCHKQGNLPKIDRAKAIRCLLLCASNHYYDFGYELADFFCHQLKLISIGELAILSEIDSWKIVD